MSRSNNTDLINPASRFFEWCGDSGTVSYYDKETKENIDVPFPFRFLILDKVSQVSGGIDTGGGYTGFWSNSVKDLSTQPFTVRSNGGIVAQGLYRDIKGTPGVKFMTGLYIAFHGDDRELRIGYLKIKGAALTAWIDLQKKHRDIYSGAFAITGAEKQKKGSTTYYSPIFEHIEKVSEASNEAAYMLDEHLQGYLAAYFAQKGAEEVEREYSGGGSSNRDMTVDEDLAAADEEIAIAATASSAADDDIPF